MNRLEIIQMVQEAAAQHGHEIKETNEIVDTLTSFAELVAAKEREECALWLRLYGSGYTKDAIVGHTIANCAEIILARGNT